MSQALSVPARVVLIDKPERWTSFDVVRKVRPLLGRRVGHAGTLDPFATGLLLVLAGQATRTSRLFVEMSKEYRMLVQFGAVSSTHDPTGVIQATGQRTSRPQVAAGLAEFVGEYLQRVPLTSAVKVGGEPLYKRAHRGEEMETPERVVTIHEATLLDFDDERQQADVLVRSGKGAYIRTLAHDLGRRLGAGAYAAALRRTRIGWFDVADALAPGQLAEALQAGSSPAVHTLSAALSLLPRYDVQGSDERLARNGNKLQGTPAGRFRVYGSGQLLGVYEGPHGCSSALVVFPQLEE